MKKKKTIGIGRFVFNIPVALILIQYSYDGFGASCLGDIKCI